MKHNEMKYNEGAITVYTAMVILSLAFALVHSMFHDLPGVLFSAGAGFFSMLLLINAKIDYLIKKKEREEQT